MKRIINVLLVALVLTFVPASYACAQRKVRGESREDLARDREANGRSATVDMTGKVVISCQWNDAKYFSEGMAWVQDDNEVWHKIDKTGKIIEKIK